MNGSATNVTFPNVVDSLKAMSLIPYICSKLKFFNYGVIVIKFVNFLPTKFNGDILFELPTIRHPLGHYRQLQGMDKKFDGHVWCKLQTNDIKNLGHPCPSSCRQLM